MTLFQIQVSYAIITNGAFDLVGRLTAFLFILLKLESKPWVTDK